MRIKRRPITLLEILLTMALFSVVVGSLFHFLKGQAKLSKQLELAKAQIMDRQELYAYLITLFTKIEGQPQITENTVKFRFDNGLQTDPNFSDTVLATLALTKKKELCLTLQSLDKKHTKTEILATNITQFEALQPIKQAITLKIDQTTYPLFLNEKP